MRSTTFDMIGMALMALAVLITAGVGITWAYLREAGSGTRPENLERAAAPAEAASDDKPPLVTHL